MCYCFHGEINTAHCLQGFLLDHITDEATGAAARHKGKGNTSSTQGHREKNKTKQIGTYKRENERERERRGRQVGGGETLSSLTPLLRAVVLTFPLCVSSSRSPVLQHTSSLACSLLLYIFISLPLRVTPPPTLSSSSASGKHCMPLNHIY